MLCDDDVASEEDLQVADRPAELGRRELQDVAERLGRHDGSGSGGEQREQSSLGRGGWDHQRARRGRHRDRTEQPQVHELSE